MTLLLIVNIWLIFIRSIFYLTICFIKIFFCFCLIQSNRYFNTNIIFKFYHNIKNFFSYFLWKSIIIKSYKKRCFYRKFININYEVFHNSKNALKSRYRSWLYYIKICIIIIIFLIFFNNKMSSFHKWRTINTCKSIIRPKIFYHSILKIFLFVIIS